MNLKEFVSESITQIISGVEAAQKQLGDSTAAVAPELAHAPDGSTNVQTTHGVIATNVTFDVAVTVESSTANGSGGKADVDILKVVRMSIGKENEQASHDQVASRLSFVVPVQLPPDPRAREKARRIEEEVERQAQAADEALSSQGY